eukprot:s478_g15.t1
MLEDSNLTKSAFGKRLKTVFENLCKVLHCYSVSGPAALRMSPASLALHVAVKLSMHLSCSLTSISYTDLPEAFGPFICVLLCVGSRLLVDNRLARLEETPKYRNEWSSDVLVPGAPAAAEVLPDSSQRLIFLAPTLRLHNRTRFTLLLRFLDGSQKEVLMLHVPATALCDASLLGPSWPMPEETAEACDMESHSSLVGEDAFGGLLVLPPNSVGAVPMASFQGRRGSGTRSALAWLTVQPMSNPSHPPSAPFQVGARVRPQVAACSGLNLAVESTSLQGLSTTTICFRPPLVFINALPIGVLTIRFTVGDDGTDRTVEWQEVTLGKLSRLGAYAASYLVEEGLQMQLRLDQGPWSDTWHRSQGNASSLLQLRQREDGAAADVVVEVCGWEVRVSSPCCFMDRSGLCNPLSMDVMNGGRPLPQENGVSLLSAHGFQEHCELLLHSISLWTVSSALAVTALFFKFSYVY